MTDWICSAYGEDGARVGALCFFSPTPGTRECLSELQCRLSLHTERRRVWKKINELADAGDPNGVFMRDAFNGPDELLGGTP